MTTGGRGLPFLVDVNKPLPRLPCNGMLMPKVPSVEKVHRHSTSAKLSYAALSPNAKRRRPRRAIMLKPCPQFPPAEPSIENCIRLYNAAIHHPMPGIVVEEEDEYFCECALCLRWKPKKAKVSSDCDLFWEPRKLRDIPELAELVKLTVLPDDTLRQVEDLPPKRRKRNLAILHELGSYKVKCDICIPSVKRFWYRATHISR